MDNEIIILVDQVYSDEPLCTLCFNEIKVKESDQLFIVTLYLLHYIYLLYLNNLFYDKQNHVFEKCFLVFFRETARLNVPLRIL